MRHSIAWPCGRQRALRIDVEPLAARDADLPLHEVDAGHHLRDRMLDLQPRVHLEEVERAILVEQELDRAGVGVVHGPRDARRPPRRSAARSSGVDRQRRRLLDHLLMTPLDRALALDERHDGAVLVAEQLDLDVARTHEPPLEVDARVAEGGAGLGPRRPNRRQRASPAIVDDRACPCRRRRRPP